MSEEKEFIKGLFVDAPRQGAPDFVKMSISIKRKDLGNWLREKSDEYINIDVKESKAGKLYAEVNNWKPEKSASTTSQSFQAPASDEDFPF